MSRNGGKHLGHKEQCKRYTNSGRCELHRQQRIKRAKDGIKEPSRKQPETAQMVWDRVIKSCPKGGTVNEAVEIKKRGITDLNKASANDLINLGWPKRYRMFGALNKRQTGRVEERMSTAKAAVDARKVAKNGR